MTEAETNVVNAPDSSKDKVPVGEPNKPKRFNNGWTPSLEALVSDWADKAQCYRWMHDKTSRVYQTYNQYMMIPVIILSTLTGTANFGLDSLFSDANSKRIASLGIGGVSIVTGIISTLANFLRYAQGSEAHSTSAILWAKFNRFMCIELALHPNDRMEAFSFLKMFRLELDRLIELSPPIPESIIRSFKHEFRMLADVKRPEITGAIEHTRAFDNSNERLKALAVEASMMLWHKKQLAKDLVLADLDVRVRNIVNEVTESRQAEYEEQPSSPTINNNQRADKPIISPNEIKINIGDLPGSVSESNSVEDHKNQYDKSASP